MEVTSESELQNSHFLLEVPLQNAEVEVTSESELQNSHFLLEVPLQNAEEGTDFPFLCVLLYLLRCSI